MKTILLLSMTLLLMVSFSLQADALTFKEKYTYDAGEADSKLSCRTISLLEVKRLLVEKLGTYLQTESEVVNFELTKDEITTFSAGIVKTEILEEEWDGKTYSLTAKIDADPDAVTQAINELRKGGENAEKVQQLKEMNEQSVEKIRELQEELARVQNNVVDVNKDLGSSSQILTAWDAFESGLQSFMDQNYKKAVKAFDIAIKSNEKDVYYLNRGKAYHKLGKFYLAQQDFSKAIQLSPKMSVAYFQKAMSLIRMGDKEGAISDMKKAAQLGNGGAKGG